MSAVFDVERFVGECRDALGGTSPMLEIKEVLDRVVAEPQAVASVLRAEPGAVVLHRRDDLTVLSVVVPAGARRSVPHDHRMWAVVGVYSGQEDNTFFRREDGGLVGSGGRAVGAGETLAMGAETIHAIHNPLEGALTAIHVYGGDLIGAARSMWTPPDSREQPFDDSVVIGSGGYRAEGPRSG